MDTTTLGIFHNQENAENAIIELSRNGFSSKDISIVIKDKALGEEFAKNTGSKVTNNIHTRIITGGLLGTIIGLILGIGATIIPGIGNLLIALPIALGITSHTASSISAALTSGLLGGLLGAVIGFGLLEEDARIYRSNIKDGSILLGVPTTGISESTARKILEKHHGDHVKTINQTN